MVCRLSGRRANGLNHIWPFFNMRRGNKHQWIMDQNTAIHIGENSFKVSSAQRWPLCPVLNELTHTSLVRSVSISCNSKCVHTIHDWMTIIPYFKFNGANQWENFIWIQMWTSFWNSTHEQNSVFDIAEHAFVLVWYESNHKGPVRNMADDIYQADIYEHTPDVPISSVGTPSTERILIHREVLGWQSILNGFQNIQKHILTFYDPH